MELIFSTVVIENANTKQAWWTCLPEDINIGPYHLSEMCCFMRFIFFVFVFLVVLQVET